MYPAASGPHLRIDNSIKALNQLCELHIVSRVAGFNMGTPEAIRYYQDKCKQFCFAPSVNNLSSTRIFRRFQIVARKFLLNDAKFLINYAKKNKINIIWFGYGNISYDLIKQVRQLAPTLRLICDTDSVWSRFIAREIPFIENPSEREKLMLASKQKEQEEKDWVDMCDITTAVSDVDADYYCQLTHNQNKIAVFSNALDLHNYQQAVRAPLEFKKPAIYLAGSFGKATSAMNRAAQWLINDILPIIKRHIPGVHCYIVGNHSDISFGHINDASITVTGKVESVLPYLKNIDVALTPLQFESGTRFKILEAAACKIPMVSTTLGAEGLPVKHEEHILIADTTEEFAQAVVRLLRDKDFGKQLAQNSYDLVQQSYSLDKLMSEASTILSRVNA
jgi:glycosyltransferase involved in cell wall biosynthesis